MTDLFRSTRARWASGIALWSVLLALATFGFVYWQTASFLREELAETLRMEVRATAADPDAAAGRVDTWIAMDLHARHAGGLFAANGQRISGNLPVMPAGLAPDGDAYRVPARVDLGEHIVDDEIWATALALPDGRKVVIAHDTDEIDRVRATSLRALGLGLLPTLIVSSLGGLVLADRARRRLGATEAALDRVMQGDLRQRLPVGERDDEFDRLAGNVNRMLDQIERLLGEVSSVGDAIAHDLRTPLTRLRARLERTRDGAVSVDEFRDAIDQGLAWIDQTLAMVTAVLRIGEIEHGRRAAGFAPVDLVQLAGEAAEFFEPFAEDKGVVLALAVGSAVPPIHGDRDLLFEAVSNLVENAVKFTPAGGRVRIGLTVAEAGPVLSVEDTGPGIPADERDRVFRRFYRAEPARQTQGHGLGLGLVAAIAQLHGFRIDVGASPENGARFDIVCHGPRKPAHTGMGSNAHQPAGTEAGA